MTIFYRGKTYLEHDKIKQSKYQSIGNVPGNPPPTTPENVTKFDKRIDI